MLTQEASILKRHKVAKVQRYKELITNLLVPLFFANQFCLSINPLSGQRGHNPQGTRGDKERGMIENDKTLLRKRNKKRYIT